MKSHLHVAAFLAVLLFAASGSAWPDAMRGLLVMGHETRRLPTVPAEQGEGARYSDGVFELRIEGGHVQLGELGGKLRSCRDDPRRAPVGMPGRSPWR